MSGIIWLASYPKSGNTWLRAFLANFLANREGPIPINELPNHILGDGFLIHYQPFVGRKIDDPDSEALDLIRPKVHTWIAGSSPQNTFVKTHSLLSSVRGVPLITPEATAGAIYIVRNPLDVAVSFAHHFKIPLQRAVDGLCADAYFLPATEEKVAQFIGGWSRHFNSWTKARGLRRHLVRYEDMLEKPLKAFGDLVRFLELPDERPRLKRAIDHASFDQLSNQESSTGFVESHPDGDTRFFRSGRVGGWRDELSTAQVDQLTEAHRDAMTRLGYLTKTGKLRGI